MVGSNLVDLLVGLNSRSKQDYGSETKERKKSDTKDRSFDVKYALPLVVMLNYWSICILLNKLVVPICRIIVQIRWTMVIKDTCLR
jgi:hypothetical protein